MKNKFKTFLGFPIEDTMKFKYRKNGKGKIITIEADHISGINPAYEDSFYHIFYNGLEKYHQNLPPRHKEIARVKEEWLLKGYEAKAKELWRREYLIELFNLKNINLTPIRDWEDNWEVTSDDIICIYEISNLSTKHFHIAEYKNGATLHAGNNYDDFEIHNSTFKDALKIWFPEHKITISKCEYKWVTEEIN